MRLLVAVWAVLVGGSLSQHLLYPIAPYQSFSPYRYSQERVVSQGRITAGARPRPSSFESGRRDPCSPTPCGPNTRCTQSGAGIAQCRCVDGYVPDGNTINGCKPQCTRSDECPDDYRCQVNKCVRVCAPGACGHDADCRARNHAAVCSCPRHFVGDPHITCVRPEPEVKELPPAPRISPCERRPCGLNADCRDDDGERAVCSCPLGYEGDPLTQCIRGECVENRDCPGTRVCQKLRCIDPCSLNLCGRGAECRARVEDRQPVCSCPRGYVGNPFESCRKFEPRELCEPSPCGHNTRCEPHRDENGEYRAKCSCISNYIGDPLSECRPECVSDSECGPSLACRNNICINPCRDACGENSYCDVRNGRAVCSCPEFFQGDPYSRCYAECTEHHMCPDDQACHELKCVNPCVGACGIGAKCNVKRHQAICSCPRTHTGDPFQSCRPFTPDDYCNPNPCGTNAICTPGYDKDRNDRAVCTCPKYYLGNPLQSCREGDCKINDDCPMSQACYNYKCATPCFTTEGASVCGESAQCKVVKHMPVCYCPTGYNGDPLDRCYIDDRRSYIDDRRKGGGFTLGRSK